MPKIDKVTGLPMTDPTPEDRALWEQNKRLEKEARNSAQQLLDGLVTARECACFLSSLVNRDEENRKADVRRFTEEETIRYTVWTEADKFILTAKLEFIARLFHLHYIARDRIPVETQLKGLCELWIDWKVGEALGLPLTEPKDSSCLRQCHILVTKEHKPS